jgi:uncharacterized protein YjcR
MSQNESAQKRKRGGQPGNKNAVTHGFYTEGGKKRFEQVDALIQDCHTLLKEIGKGRDVKSQFKSNIF